MYQPIKNKGFLKKGRDKICSLKAKLSKVIKNRKSEKGKKSKINDDPKAIYEESIVPTLKTELALVGFEIFNADYKLSFFLGFIIVDASTYAVINLIDIWLIWGSSFENVCFCLVTWMLGFTGLMLAYTLSKNRVLYCDLLKIIYDFGDALDKKEESEEIVKYKKHSLVCKKLCLITTVLCGGGGIVCTFYPIVIYFYTGQAVLPYGFFIPGVSTTTNPGYLINYAYQIFQCYGTALGTMQATFHSYLFFVSNAFFQIDNLIIKLRKLNGKIVKKPNEDGHETELAEIIKLHQRFQSYLDKVDGVFNKMFFVNIGCYTFMNIITLFVLVNQIWFIGYYLLAVLFGLIFVPCAIGTVIEVKNDELVNEIYSISWYLLTPKERKTYRLFLLGAQKTPMLTCGKFLPLNVNTFRLTYSKIYSFLMFLLDTQRKNY